MKKSLTRCLESHDNGWTGISVRPLKLVFLEMNASARRSRYPVCTGTTTAEDFGVMRASVAARNALMTRGGRFIA
jgi:hypothetical protein